MDSEKPLVDPRHEAFALVLARGLPRIKAVRLAGLGRSRTCAGDMARRAEVKARVEALARREAPIAMAASAPTLAALVRLVEAVRGATGPRAREVRLTLKLIAQLRAMVDEEMRDAVEPPPPVVTPLPQLSTEEWVAKYARLGASWSGGR